MLSRAGAGLGRAARSFLGPMLLTESRRRTAHRASRELATARARLARMDQLP